MGTHNYLVVLCYFTRTFENIWGLLISHEISIKTHLYPKTHLTVNLFCEQISILPDVPRKIIYLD